MHIDQFGIQKSHAESSYLHLNQKPLMTPLNHVCKVPRLCHVSAPIPEFGETKIDQLQMVVVLNFTKCRLIRTYHIYSNDSSHIGRGPGSLWEALAALAPKIVGYHSRLYKKYNFCMMPQIFTW